MEVLRDIVAMGNADTSQVTFFMIFAIHLLFPVYDTRGRERETVENESREWVGASARFCGRGISVKMCRENLFCILCGSKL